LQFVSKRAALTPWPESRLLVYHRVLASHDC
jgi:hypothetical protein